MLKKLILFAAFILTFIVVFTTNSYAQSNTVNEQFEAVITRIVEEKEIEIFEQKQTVQRLELLITSGSLKGQTVQLENGNLPTANPILYQTGDKIILTKNQDPEGNDLFIITDYQRTDALTWLFLLFIGFVLVVSRKKGVSALLGLAFSFLVIFQFVLPRLYLGQNPVFTAVLGAFIIIPVTFIITHGFNQKTVVAIVGTIFGLIFTSWLANFFLNFGHLTGFASEEANFLQVAKQGTLDIQGLLLAGIIIGVLGILDDVTVSQSSVVFELKKANPSLKLAQLYTQAMNVGRDHIASVVNTLVIVYTGASLPLLLLFIDNPLPFLQVINQEIIAEEIVRTLVASIGLISTIPITTLLAAWVSSQRRSMG